MKIVVDMKQTFDDTKIAHVLWLPNFWDNNLLSSTKV